MTDAPIFLTVNEARDVLRLGRSKFYELVSAGEIRLSKIHGKSLVAKIELDRYVATLLPTDHAA